MKLRNKYKKTRTIKEEDIHLYGQISQDYNPIHFDDEFAGKTIYRQRIAHGFIAASMISSGVTELLGAGNVILDLSIRMKSPVFINDKLSLSLDIAETTGRREIVVNVSIENQDNRVVIEGTTTCMKVY